MKNSRQRPCPECDREEPESLFDRRSFLQTSAGLGAALAVGELGARTLTAADAPATAAATTAAAKTPESLVKVLFETLSPKQSEQLCFAWDFTDSERGLLRTRVSNNWHITKPVINSEFFTADQKQMVRDIWAGIIQPEWQPKVDKQLKDDAGGFGNSQNIAFFGKPGDGKFEFVMTGRHMTLRCDGNTADHVAFGGPIFYGHAASGFNEKPGHPGNVYWEQALVANKVYEMLDSKQRAQAAIPKQPGEGAVAFREKGPYPGIAVSELSSDQKEHVQKVLQKLIEPYRQSDRDEVTACLKAQGGLDKCCLSFYTEEDLGDDKVWDSWRLEGPAFVWHFRGTPHVHVWVNIADDPSVKLNA